MQPQALDRDERRCVFDGTTVEYAALCVVLMILNLTGYGLIAATV